MSAVGKDKLKDRSDKPTIYNSNKPIMTGYIQRWHSLSKANYQENVQAKRAHKLVAWKTGQSNKDDAATSNCMKQPVTQNNNYKQQIKFLKRSAIDNSNNNDLSNNDNKVEDACNQFGGKASKKKKKRVKFDG